MDEIQTGIYKQNGKLYTKAASSEKVYGEPFIDAKGETFREWVPERSKVGAAVMNKLDLGVEKTDDVLYLGAASGPLYHISPISLRMAMFTRLSTLILFSEACLSWRSRERILFLS